MFSAPSHFNRKSMLSRTLSFFTNHKRSIGNKSRSTETPSKIHSTPQYTSTSALARSYTKIMTSILLSFQLIEQWTVLFYTIRWSLTPFLHLTSSSSPAIFRQIFVWNIKFCIMYNFIGRNQLVLLEIILCDNKWRNV